MFQHRLPNAPPGWDVLTTEEVEALVDDDAISTAFTRQWGRVSANGSAVSNGVALLDDVVEQAETQVAVISDAGTGVKYEAVSGGKDPVPEAGWLMGSNNMMLNQLPNYFTKFKIDELDQMRFFAGFADVAVAPSSDNDCGGGPAVGIVFSLDRVDTNFQFVAHDGTTQTLVDTGIVADLLVHFLRVKAISGTEVEVTLYDASFVAQATTTFTTQLMAGTVEMAPTEMVTDYNDANAFYTAFYAQLDLAGT